MSDIEFGEDANIEGEGRPEISDLGIEIDPEVKKEILEYLTSEFSKAAISREGREKKWIKYRSQREAMPEPISGEHAIESGSRIQPPLTQIHAQTAYAKVKGYWDTAKKEFWQVSSSGAEPQDHDDAKLLTKYFGILANSPNDLNIARVKRIVADEASFLGLLVVKVTWETLEWKFKSFDDGAEAPSTKSMIFHDGPSIIPIPQEDIYYPPYWDELQRMPWTAHEIHYPLHEFENKIKSGFYDEPVDADGFEIDPKSWLRSSFSKSEEASEKLRGYASSSPEVIDLVEFHFYWDIDGDGIWEDLIWTIHVKSKTVVRMRYNAVAAREFVSFGFIPRSFMLESRSVGQICEGLQDEVSGTHRLRNDGMKLSAIKMLAIRRATLRENKNTIYQGKVWITDNPREDMQAIALGEVPPSSLASENMVWSMTSQAVGLSSVDRGFSDPTLGTRDTFKGQQLRLAQSENIMSTIIETANESWSQVGMLVFFQLVMNSKRVIWNERQLKRLSNDEIDRLEKILSIPMSEVPRRLKFSIYTTDIEHSYEAKRDTIMQLMQLTYQAQPQLVQLANAVFGPQGMQLKAQAPEAWAQLLQVYVGSVNLLKEVYQFADFVDTENYLQDVSKYEKLLELMKMQNAQQIAALNAATNQQGGMQNGGQNTGAGQPASEPGMAAFGPESGGLEPGGAGAAQAPAGAGEGLNSL
ncbi:MAG: hypothetical protein WC324_02145 [Candidatus Omnitrophota bacterium]|jgi:hypothetical protein